MPAAVVPAPIAYIKVVAVPQENEITGAISALDDGAEVDCGLTEEAVNLQTPLRAACAKVGVGGLGRFLFFPSAIWGFPEMGGSPKSWMV